MACVAVGESANSNVDHYVPLVERWDGHRWTVQRTPHGNNWYLYSVSCPAATDCIAVGSRLNRASHRNLTLAERWDGHRWSVQQTADPPAPHSSSLQSVSCSSAASCMAVGYYFVAGDPVALAERWNGHRWSPQRLPDPAGSNETQLYGVSCFSAAACMAIGDRGVRGPRLHGATLAERWNGHRWSIEPTPNLVSGPTESPGATQSSVLSGVSCPSARVCVAVGDGGAAFGNTVTLAERWDGHRWSLAKIPHPAHVPSRLGGISCSSARACTAAGDYGYDHGPYTPLVEHGS
jgi:hypothetical protein